MESLDYFSMILCLVLVLGVVVTKVIVNQMTDTALRQVSEMGQTRTEALRDLRAAVNEKELAERNLHLSTIKRDKIKKQLAKLKVVSKAIAAKQNRRRMGSHTSEASAQE